MQFRIESFKSNQIKPVSLSLCPSILLPLSTKHRVITSFKTDINGDITDTGVQTASWMAYPNFNILPFVAPPMGDRLDVAVWLMSSEDPADSTF